MELLWRNFSILAPSVDCVDTSLEEGSFVEWGIAVVLYVLSVRCLGVVWNGQCVHGSLYGSL